MRTLVGIVLVALALQGTGADSAVRYFRYQRTVLNSPSAGQTCMLIPPDVFAHAAPMLADLRLYRNGAEIPWAMRLAAPIAGEEKTITPLNLGRQEGKTVFDATMPEGSYSDLELSIGAQDFIATVEVSGSSGVGPLTKLGSFTIFDLTRQKLGRSTVLHLPESNFRSLHFRVIGPVSPEAITGVSAQRLPAGQPEYVAVATSSKTIEKPRSSAVEFTVPANTPVDRIVFVPGATPSVFSRDVHATAVSTANNQAQADRYPMYTANFSGSLLRVHREEDGHRIDEERLILETPGAVAAEPQTWTVTIENGDDAPISIASVRLEMLERHLCYEAAAAGTTTLLYGDSQLASPTYDYQRLFAAANHPTEANLGPEQRNPEFQERPDRRAFTEKHPALLWIALIAVVVLLSGIALRTAKRTTASNA
jgi:Protein of unknown function (DUF3999)